MPSSTIRPPEKTRIQSSARTVDNRCAMTIAVRFTISRSIACWIAPSDSGIETGGRLVEDQDRCVGQEGARNGDTLALTT